MEIWSKGREGSRGEGGVYEYREGIRGKKKERGGCRVWVRHEEVVERYGKKVEKIHTNPPN